MRQRILTGVIAAVVFLVFMLLGSYPFAAFIMFMAVLGFDEFLRLQQIRRRKSTEWIGWLGLFAVAVPWHTLFSIHPPSFPVIIWCTALLLLTASVWTKNQFTIREASLHVLAILYIGFGFHSMISTRLISPHGLFWTLLVFNCIWLTDSGAYFTGYMIGRHKLWPSISPKKTIEGAVGGLLFSTITAVAFHFFYPAWLSVPHAVYIGLTAGCSGQVGDLIQSAYKRERGVKDTGTILPGHGGILDRVDSWLIVFPLLHFLMLLPNS